MDKKNPIQRYRRGNAASGIACFAFAVLAVLLLFGLVICAVLSETVFRAEGRRVLFYILAGSFAGGAVLSALAAYLFGKLSALCNTRWRDARELADSESSFFVGDEVLATFASDALELHAEGKEERVTVPYAQLRIFSVCSRIAPRERGTDKIVLEIPARYLKKREDGDGEPVLVETDYKPRLLGTIRARGLEILGELPEKKGRGVRFSKLKKFSMPMDAKRKRSIVFAVLGGLCVGAGIAVCFLTALIGAIIATFGAFFCVRSLKKAIFSGQAIIFYREGIFWREEQADSRLFLKWEEIESIRAEKREGVPCLCITCVCGRYVLPLPAGAYEYLTENFPEKCEKGRGKKS